jgi:hypothetical protein
MICNPWPCYNFAMADIPRAITWEAPEHRHNEKSSDWYWALGIVAIAAAAAVVVFGNTLFAVVILLGASTMIIVAHREPKMMEFAVTMRGIRVGSELLPYTTLESFYIDEENPNGPQLLVKSKRLFMPLIILPIPEEHTDDIDDLISSRLPEEHLEEPLSHRMLEFFGF